MRHGARTVRLLALVGLEVAAVAGLHRLGSLPWMRIDWSDLGGWLEAARPDDALVGIARVAGLACAYWLLVSTSLYSLARASRLPGAIRAVRWATLPAIRRVADRALAVALAASIAGTTAPALARRQPPSRRPVIVTGEGDTVLPPGASRPHVPQGRGGAAHSDGQTTGPSSTSSPPGDVGDPHKPDPGDPAYVPVPAGDDPSDADRGDSEEPPSSSAGGAPDPAAGGSPTEPGSELTRDVGASGGSNPPEAALPEPAGSEVHEVAPGDNLWDIAARQVAEATGRSLYELGAPEIRAYWLKVVDVNLGRLRSGNPDLIYPGEAILLPAVGERS